MMISISCNGETTKQNVSGEYHLPLEFRLNRILDDVKSGEDSSYGEITLLCDKYGSDKGSFHNGSHPYPWSPHTYSCVYETLFHDIKYKVKNVFECGIGTNNVKVLSNMSENGRPGASLRVWRDYFVNAQIYGADVDEGCLFEEERIETGWLDQCSPDAIKSYFSKLGIKFDIMIDDGLHTKDAALSLLQNSLSYLKKGGIYVIEDLTQNDIYEIHNYISKQKGYSVKYLIMSENIADDNNLVVITSNVK